MPITTSEITQSNDNKKYNHHDIPLIKFITNWVMDHSIIFPKWQREDCWKDDYRIKLIESILTKNDIPKFYLSQINDEEKYYLLDGGHRTRTILKYINNLFSIKIDDSFVYYDKIPDKKSSKKNRCLNEHEKIIFDNYKLTLTIYENLTEADTRRIFNNLQNSQPMTMADVVNSYESPLIDYLRNLYTFEINDNKTTLEEFACSVKDCYLSSNEHSELLYHLVSIWTIVVPHPDIDDKVISALSYTLQGVKRETSMCYKYVQEYNIDLIPEDKLRFQDILKWYINTIIYLENSGFNKKKILKKGECLSLIHSHLYIKNFSLSKYLSLINDQREHEFLKKEASKIMDDPVALSENKIAHEHINSKYKENLNIWKSGYTNINKDHMKRRFNIINEFCIDNNINKKSLKSDCDDIDIIA